MASFLFQKFFTHFIHFFNVHGCEIIFVSKGFFNPFHPSHSSLDRENLACTSKCLHCIIIRAFGHAHHESDIIQFSNQLYEERRKKRRVFTEKEKEKETDRNSSTPLLYSGVGQGVEAHSEQILNITTQVHAKREGFAKCPF